MSDPPESPTAAPSDGVGLYFATEVPLLVGGHHASVNGTMTCTLTAGSPKCWGDNDGGQLGLGFTSVDESSPTELPGL